MAYGDGSSFAPPGNVNPPWGGNFKPNPIPMPGQNNNNAYGLPQGQTPNDYVKADQPPTLSELHQYTIHTPGPTGLTGQPPTPHPINGGQYGDGGGGLQNGVPGSVSPGYGDASNGGLQPNPPRNATHPYSAAFSANAAPVTPNLTVSPTGQYSNSQYMATPNVASDPTALSQPSPLASPFGSQPNQLLNNQQPAQDQASQNGNQSPAPSLLNPQNQALAAMAGKKPGAKAPAGKPYKAPNYSDSEYQSEIRNLQNALADYKSKMGINQTRAGTQYAESKRNLDQQKTRDLSDIANDFAARGIINSGVYGQKLGDYNQQANQQYDTLSTNYKNAQTDLNTGFKDYQRQYQQQMEQARIAAIRRRAQALNKI